MGGPPEILLVEDNPGDLKLAMHALRKSGLANRVHVARDGKEALEVFFGKEDSSCDFSNIPRLVLLDLKLPLVDGLEVLRRLKADERTRPVPVVILTTSREERDLAGCYTLGANSYIVKPMDFEKFTQAVSHLGYYWLMLNEVPVALR